MFYIELDQNNEFKNRYIKTVHGSDLCENVLKNGGIALDELLYDEILKYNRVELIEPKADTNLYYIEDLKRFKEIPIEPTLKEPEKTTDDYLMELDYRLTMIELGI